MNGVLFEEARPVAAVSPNRADIVCFIGFVNRRWEAVPEQVAAWLRRRGRPSLPGPTLEDKQLDHLRDSEQFASMRQWLLSKGWPALPQSVLDGLEIKAVRDWLLANGWPAAPSDVSKDTWLVGKAAALVKALKAWLVANSWPALPSGLREDTLLAELDDAPGLRFVRDWLLANGWPKLKLDALDTGGFLVRTPLPATAKDSLVANGWRQAGVDVRDDDDLVNTPVPLENFGSFDRLFAWENRAGSGWATWLGAAVRSFFAQGGARCFVVRVGDAWPFDKPREPEELAFAADTRLARLRQLVPGYAGGDAGSPANREVWRGLEVLHSLEEAAFVCLPDLPELVADATLGPVGLRELPPGPEEFTKYSPVVAPLTDEIRRFSRSPACTESGYGEWFKVANQAAAFLNSWRKDVELILAVPLPAKGIVSQGDLLRVLHQKDRPGLATRTKDGALGGIATAFLQLVYPWLGTDSAALLPGELEPPDGAFAGIAARTAAKLGAHRSLGRQPLHRVSRFFPPLSARDQQLITSKGEAPALIHRVSLLGQTPDGPRVLSDVTTSLDAAHRPASVGRLTAAILRTARRLGQEVTFDNSGSELWRAIERRLDSLLGQFFSAGALLGDNPAAAFSVTCDETTTTQNDLDNGRVFAVVRFAPAQPVGVITVVLALRDGAPLTAETQD